MLHRLIRYSCTNAPHISPTLNRSSALQHFERSNVVEICNGMMFDFYTGLPHMQKRSSNYSTCALWGSCFSMTINIWTAIYYWNVAYLQVLSTFQILTGRKLVLTPYWIRIYIMGGHGGNTWLRPEEEVKERARDIEGMRRRVERRCLSTSSLPTVGQKLVFRLLMKWAWYVNKKQTILQDVPLMISLL